MTTDVRVIAGVDAGGTKTDILICDTAGHVLHRDISEGLNASRDGAAYTAARIAERIRASGYAPDALYAGIAGAGNAAVADAAQAELMRFMPRCRMIKIASDAFNALNSLVGMGDGIALIAGTGASAFVRTRGSIFQAGGRGYLIDDAGSGYWVGRACLNAAYRALDGRGAPTSLKAGAEELLGMPLADAIPAIYAGGAAFIASFAPPVFEHAANGDAVAGEIAAACARELILLLRACHEYAPDISVCVPSGGMFKAEYLRNAVAEGAAEMGMRCVFPDAPPVYGAVVAAAAHAGIKDISIK